MKSNYPEAPAAAEALLTIERLLQFALQRRLLHRLDVSAARNGLLDLFCFAQPFAGSVPDERLDSPVPLLELLLDYGYSISIIESQTVTQRDLLDARIMGFLMPRPSEVAAAFQKTAERDGIKAATDDFYRLSIDCNYIRMDRIAKNPHWPHATPYGSLEITVNLSKPEKDPKEIARLRTLAPSSYPSCLLCADNVGYAGREDHPARQNLRMIPLRLQDEEWQFQYSPYVYYNEHSIVLKGAHEPMALTHQTFARLLDFVDQFPHYFIGSNADLPIVGGSILSHDHFQAGRHPFPMESAPLDAVFMDESKPGIRFGIVRWPMSVLRLNGMSKEGVLDAACRILDCWKEYSDEGADVLAYTEQPAGERIPHNTVTPIARMKKNGEYELDLVLRNNRTSERHPDGIFHPHAHLHHIKKENIGLIEVMGLAVLPGRLKAELEQLELYLTGQSSEGAESLCDPAHPLHKHAEWVKRLLDRYGALNTLTEAESILRAETGEKFMEALMDAGVFKRNGSGMASFVSFLNSIGLKLV
ncbi:UDP-glucose--hexose-1-phosphate uridylyltransferase [Paenibacillus sp. GCM10027627]|uniref:UDP-glucose--hexose-1-phosphate uridylyltransferase n=1 Tax=unclassified Paenibacillus TaxID=185978 RepID=UPI00362DC1E0